MSSERDPVSIGRKTKRALGGVALALALLGGGEVYDSRPAEAQTLGEESDSEYAPECPRAHYPPIWLSDLNGDGQPGPQGGEFLCRPLPGCNTIAFIPFTIMASFERAGVISPPPGTVLNRHIGWCVGEPWPEFEDYSELLGDEPWIEENIEHILGSPFWYSDEIKRQVDIRPWAFNTWWWKRVYGQDAPTTDPATPETTETATEPEASPEPTTPVSAEPETTIEPEVSPEPTTTVSAEPETTIEPEVSPEPTTTVSAEPETTIEPEASPEPTTTVSAEPEPAADGASETPSATVTEPEPDLTIDQVTPEAPETTIEPEASSEPSTPVSTDPGTAADSASETQPAAEPDLEPDPTVDQDAPGASETAVEPEPSTPVSAEPQAAADSTSETRAQDGYLNRNKTAIFAGGAAVLVSGAVLTLGMAWRRRHQRNRQL